ncbi:zinc-binding metallopeptidase family protein [Devosia beringensis]|uniref:zinc-binding metallopeptidase family protein n=1 Tax=Devosia beringensis TaxID=2657486 RepID=UPI00186B8C41|nr:putative zinc-binding peptidase [Devosia beringensis]
MKLFACDHCGNTVYFENASCERCGHTLGYRSDKNALVSLVQQAGTWASSTFPDEPYIFCQNARHGACNWLIRAVPGGDTFCAACRHNDTIPDISDPLNLAHWQVIERAKKRLFYSLLRLDLPLQTRTSNPEHGLSFRFLADTPIANERVLTGHENGIITIALVEADDAEREARRTSMGEPYRTLLGHFRHEIGHHYWDLLIDGRAPLPEFRRLFGNESVDYAQALQAHYADGAPAGWSQSYISSYATAHPWEDFAETFAHYLHIVDTVEMASAFGVHARVDGQEADLSIQTGFVPYNAPDAQTIVDNWVPVASMLNNLNRAMGHPDAYPFVLTPQVIEKLSFVHQLVHRQWTLGAR